MGSGMAGLEGFGQTALESVMRTVRRCEAPWKPPAWLRDVLMSINVNILRVDLQMPAGVRWKVRSESARGRAVGRTAVFLTNPPCD